MIANHPSAELGATVRAIRQARDRRAIGRIEAAFSRHASAAEITIVGDVAGLALERLRAVEEARRDALTGVLNRRGFFEAAHECVAACPGPVAVGLFDLDGLKAINDRHGHEVGSASLRAAAEALRAAFGGAVIGRIGGDEFAAVIPDRSDAALLRARLDAIVRARAAMPDVVRLRLSAGLVAGIAVRPADVDELLRRADADLYERRREHRGGVRRRLIAAHGPHRAASGSRG